MSNALEIQEWLDVIRDEYLHRFIRDGGSAIKFAVPVREDLGSLFEKELKRMASSLDYKVVSVDSGETRVHMLQEIFFQIASQIEWRLLARRMVLRLCKDLPYDTSAIDPGSETPILEAIGAANAVEESQIALDLRRKLPQAVTQNRNMSRDFRLAMTHLCLTEMGGAGQNLEAIPLTDWLTGRSRRISNVRAYSIFNSIVRTNARHFLESLLHWVRFAGYPGTVILLNDSRVTLRRNPRDERRFYSAFGGNGPLRIVEGTHRRHRPVGRTLHGGVGPMKTSWTMIPGARVFPSIRPFWGGLPTKSATAAKPTPCLPWSDWRMWPDRSNQNGGR